MAIFVAGMRERIEEFDVRHGSDCLRVDGWIVYSDGASRDTDPYGPLLEPSQDLFERSKLIVTYYVEKHRRAAAEFESERESMLVAAKMAARAHQPGFPPMPTDQAVEKLKRLKGYVRRCQKELKKAQQELIQHQPSWITVRENAAAEDRQRLDEFISSVSDIKL